MIFSHMRANFDLLVLVTIVVLFSLAISVLMLIMRYLQHQSRELISTVRDAYEKQIYVMNDKLTASFDRLKDVNHLLLGSQAAQTQLDPGKRVPLSAFLKANSVHSNEIEPDPQLVFVLTPFNNRYSEVFKIIRTTCLDVGLICLRGDEQFIEGDILPHILKLMCKASIIIANIEGRNANVFYELGLAHAMDKNTILITKSIDMVPVDIKSKRIIIYNESSELQSRLKDELLKFAFYRAQEDMPAWNSDVDVRSYVPLEIDSRPIHGDVGMVGLIAYDPEMHVDRFLDTVFQFLNRRGGHINPYTYGTKWLLQDENSGKTYSDIGIEYCNSKGRILDRRTIKSVGIAEGLKLRVIRINECK